MRHYESRKYIVGILLIAFNLIFLVPAMNLAQSVPGPETMPEVGIWYSTWYAKAAPVQRTWISGFGTGFTKQFLIDMNLDGMDDAVVYYPGNGSFLVALSSGTWFTNAIPGGTRLGVNSTTQFLADVTADRLPDAIFYFASNGTWRVGINNGTGFDHDITWIAAFGIGSSAQLMGNPNGDGKRDAIAIYNSTGKWAIATSNGTAFRNITSSTWIQGFGTNSDHQMMKDINYDGKDDAIAFYNNGGHWRSSISNGTAFITPRSWINGYGEGSTQQLLANRPDLFNMTMFSEAFTFFNGDTNGDGLAGDWYVAGKGCMNSGFGAGSDQQFIGNVTGDKRGWSASVAFYASNGTWQVQPYYFMKQNIYNTWDAWKIKYLPWTLGSYQTYDSGNISVIDEHLSMIAAAGINFLLLDETNNLYVDDGYIFLRAKVLASRINIWNSNASHHQVRYAIVIGGNQFSHDPASLEYEAREVWNQFVNTTDGGVKNYYYLDGKPLLVDYCPPADQAAWTRWNDTKTNAGRFTLRWAQSPAGSNNYGWEVRDGSIPGKEVMVVMPGWNNNKGAQPVSRQFGFYYSSRCWQMVLAGPTLPSLLVINSFNEYAEETAVAPADTSHVSGKTERWINGAGVVDNFMYWNITLSYIQILENGGHAEYQIQFKVIIFMQAIPFAIASLAMIAIFRRKRIAHDRH